MPLTVMEHYLVLSDDIDETRRFYINIIGLEDGFRADLGFPGYWLYLDSIPVLHIADWNSYTTHSSELGIPVSKRSSGTGCFDHIAFNGNDAESMLEKLDSLNCEYYRNDVPEVGLVQIFLNDPNGLKIELNYRY